jgi:hypothetical protein
MKTSAITTIIIAAVLSINVHLLANNTSPVSPTAKGSDKVSLTALAPTTPSEATFDETSEELLSITDLAPATPAEADFDDNAETLTIDITLLAPTTPAVADFE